ncbi:MAG: NTP transferase domain-containing protein, partial [Immundisolibacteraceae bacterium]|nr:NTP transferase domain-containing protein [Immundisolibacteraceae bacterium]
MQVVILCGGKGTRAYPFTEYFPKPMMPINGTPILVHLMRIYAAQGFTDFVLAAGHRKEMLYDYFEGRFQDWNINIVDTGDDGDTGDRIHRCEPYVGERFLATYGDGLGNVDLHAIIEAHERNGAIASLTTVPLRSQYGLVVSDD